MSEAKTEKTAGWGVQQEVTDRPAGGEGCGGLQGGGEKSLNQAGWGDGGRGAWGDGNRSREASRVGVESTLPASLDEGLVQPRETVQPVFQREPATAQKKGCREAGRVGGGPLGGLLSPEGEWWLGLGERSRRSGGCCCVSTEGPAGLLRAERTGPPGGTARCGPEPLEEWRGFEGACCLTLSQPSQQAVGPPVGPPDAGRMQTFSQGQVLCSQPAS